MYGITEDRQKYADQLATLSSIYYRYTDFHNNAALYIYPTPFKFQELDSLKAYNILELISFVKKNHPEKLDSILAFIKGAIVQVHGFTKHEVENLTDLDIMDRNINTKYPVWLALASSFLLNTYDSVIDVNFRWKITDKIEIIDTFSNEAKSKVLLYASWLHETINDVKNIYRQFSGTKLILFSTNCIYKDPNCISNSNKRNEIDDSIRAHAYRQYYNIDFDIDGLVESSLYKSVSTPYILQSWLSKGLGIVKEDLDSSYREKVKNVKIDFSQQNSDLLWMRNDGQNIFISPFLVRAVFIKLIRNNTYIFHILNKYDKSHNEFKMNDHSDFPNPERVIFEMFEAEFIMNFVFLISHELAHIYLGHTPFNFNEYQADCYGWKNCKNIIIKSYWYSGVHETKASLGVFESLFDKALKENKSFLWGFHTVNDADAQKNRLLTLKKMDLNCQ
jgi:hypothetical protein